MRGIESDHDRVTLSPADAAAVDALLNGEPGGDPARKDRAEAWLNVLDHSPLPEPAGDLAARTLAAVQAERMRIASPSNPRPEPTAPGAPQTLRPARTAPRWAWRRRFAEIGTMAVAAALLLAVTLEGVGQGAKIRRPGGRAANLLHVAVAVSNYASSGRDGELPMLALPANINWLKGNVEVGGTAAVNNAANLLPLITGQYLTVKSLFCAGAGVPDGPVAVEPNALPPIGYSYRNMYAADKPRWDTLKSTIVLADKNPVFGDIVRPEWDQKNSFNHDGKGNYVLRADGTVTWETSPNIGPAHDNIWTVGSGKEPLVVYTGRELPATLADVFVCP